VPQVRQQLVSAAKRALASRGYELTRISDPFPDERRIIDRVAPFTMTTEERISDTCTATRYVIDNGLPGAFVECGVWKGGNAMAMALVVLAAGEERELWLYDTFAGMTEPTAEDTHLRPHDYDVHERWRGEQAGTVNTWAYAPLDAVTDAMASTGYQAQLVRYIVGPVEETIPAQMPNQIALLRLDTDWYESTKHELEHLFPRLVQGGVLIIDDYGTWGGCRRAVDEYVASHHVRLFLHRSDPSGRIAVKQS